MKVDKISTTQDYITEQAVSQSSTNLIVSNSVLIVTRSGILERTLPVAINSCDVAINQDLKAITPDIIIPELVLYFLKSHEIIILRSCAKDGTTVSSIDSEKLKNFPIPLPPLNEQRRIVEKIEALTARSRKAREALEAIPNLLDQFRQSVLAAAFCGDLTADWREQNPDVEPAEVLLEQIKGDLKKRKPPSEVDTSSLFELPETWNWASLESIATHKSGTAFKSKEFTQEGIQVIRLGNVYKGKFDLGRDPVFLPSKYLDGNFTLEPGNIVVSQTGTRFKKDYGNFVLIPPGVSKLFLNQRLLAVFCHPMIDPEYVTFASKLETYRNFFFSTETGGVNQGNVGVAGVMEGPIPLAPKEEMSEIVRRIKTSFSAIDAIENLLTENYQDLDQLDQSILAKAFRGELVPQDPNDEPAAVLLERIRAEREKVGKKRGRKG